jgi:hypothetical protein
MTELLTFVSVSAGSVLMTSAKPRVVCQTARWWRMIHHSRERVSTAPELGINHGDLRLVCTCLAMENHWSSLWTVLVLTLLPDAVWNSVVSVVTNDRWFLHTKRFSTRRSHSVSLCGLPLRGWAIVAPRCFHFTITVLTVDQGSFSRAEIWRTDLLERWHPITMPRWKSMSPSVRPFSCQCLCMEIAWQCARFYTSVSNGCCWNSRIY